MDVHGFIEAINNPAFTQWQNAKNKVAPWDQFQVIDIIKSQSFKRWQSANPSGTIDQYYLYLCQEQAYKQSPQYQIRELQNEVEQLNLEVSQLNAETYELREEINYKDETISTLRTFTWSFIGSTFFLLIVSIILMIKLKRKNRIIMNAENNR